MKFIVDAQLPKKLSDFPVNSGYGSIHTLELPLKNNTTDREIISLSMREKRIVITKDGDFYNSFLQKSEPHKLIFLTVGNMSVFQILEIFSNNLAKISDEIQRNNVLEISSKNIITII